MEPWKHNISELSLLVHVMSCCLLSTKPITLTKLTYSAFQWNLNKNTQIFLSRKCTWKCCLSSGVNVLIMQNSWLPASHQFVDTKAKQSNEHSSWQANYLHKLFHKYFIIITVMSHEHHDLLTHFPLDKMAAISQTIFSDTFSWMKSFVFWLKFHWSFFLMLQLTMAQHWFR